MTKLITTLTASFLTASMASAVTVTYSIDAGGSSMGPLNGLQAQATFTQSGNQLAILLKNTSTGVPADFDVASSLLVSIGMNLPHDIVTGDSALIGPGSIGLAKWSDRGPGDSVAEEWLWTNDFGGDLMRVYKHVISTSDGQGGGTTTKFDGRPGPGVDGPFGGIAAKPPLIAIPGPQKAVSNSIEFVVTLAAPLTDAQLEAAALGSIVEFGSDARYLTVPEPGVSALMLFGLLAATLRSRRAR